MMQRQHRVHGPPGELSVPDFPAARRPETTRFAHREGRKIVMQHEAFFVGAGQRVDELLVLAGAEPGSRRG